MSKRTEPATHGKALAHVKAQVTFANYISLCMCNRSILGAKTQLTQYTKSATNAQENGGAVF